MTEVARRIAKRIEKELRQAGRWLDDEQQDASTRFDALRDTRRGVTPEGV